MEKINDALLFVAINPIAEAGDLNSHPAVNEALKKGWLKPNEEDGGFLVTDAGWQLIKEYFDSKDLRYDFE